MGMWTNFCYGICTIFLLFNWVWQSVGASTIERLPPPTNITFQVNMFAVEWKWKKPENLGDYTYCTDKYKCELLIGGSMHKTHDNCPSNWKIDFGSVDLNQAIGLNVMVYPHCNGSKVIKWSSKTIHLAKGDPGTSVTNFTCVWYNKEYMNCTWLPGKHSPPDKKVTLYYWLENSAVKENLFNLTQIEPLLSSGATCPQYIYENGVPLGCHFKAHHAPKDDNKYRMMVTDSSHTIRPYIAEVRVIDLLKLRPPTVNATRTVNSSILITWNPSDAVPIRCLTADVEVTASNSAKPDNSLVPAALRKEIPNVLPDVDYTIRVRVSEETFCGKINWSDWSEKMTLLGERSNNTLYIVLLILTPLVVTVATIVLLIYLKRLKILVFPPIPNPRIALKNSFGDPAEFQQWIKYGKVPVCNKTPKEEICSVILL
ncbi:interleukin-13 receptor subunit alpha-1 [Bombina bombina]|uniref:interleukin-13 receptor subunit alpha-1 n=1 Tax=Bombina bombina TaxID=8345 RepID=UPI00235A919D|nr:interleukin-13 receptor subunit alpha-1 [Bombina bombina]